MEDCKQVALPEETETVVSIDYANKSFSIWTNKATLMNRITRLGFKPFYSQKLLDGSIYSMEWRLPTKEIGKFMRTGIFKYD